MGTKIRQVGNSLGVLIPREITNQLNLNKGDNVAIYEANGEIVIRPVPLYVVKQKPEIEALVRDNASLFRMLPSD